MTSEILTIITMFVTILFGFLAKKISWFKDYMIPLQNLTIGLLFALVEWIITKDFSMAVAMSGLMAGGTYDLIKNLKDAYKEYQTQKESKTER